eukprot:2388325-Prorocentrum_lima.AAC.1
MLRQRSGLRVGIPATLMFDVLPWWDDAWPLESMLLLGLHHRRRLRLRLLLAATECKAARLTPFT